MCTCVGVRVRACAGAGCGCCCCCCCAPAGLPTPRLPHPSSASPLPSRCIPAQPLPSHALADTPHTLIHACMHSSCMFAAGRPPPKTLRSMCCPCCTSTQAGCAPPPAPWTASGWLPPLWAAAPFAWTSGTVGGAWTELRRGKAEWESRGGQHWMQLLLAIEPCLGAAPAQCAWARVSRVRLAAVFCAWQLIDLAAC